MRNSAPADFPLIDRTFAKFGVRDHARGRLVARHVPDGPLKVREPFTRNILQKIEAAPWPYLPVDLLPIFIALGVRAEGSVMFWNKVYDGALGWTGELSKFGAHAFLSDPHRVITFGGKPLAPAEVESPYIIRVAIALLMVAASIEGRSRDPQRHADPPRASALRREPARAGRAGGVGGRRLSPWPGRTHVSETPATAMLKAHGVAFTEHPYEYVEHGGAQHSAQVLGFDPFTVVKTLVMEDEKARPLIVLMHGNRKVSTKNLARQIGAKSVEPCKPEVANRHSGYLVGGTSPFGTRKADAGVHRGDHPRRCRASPSTAGGAATWSASTRRCACSCWGPSRCTARWQTERLHAAEIAAR